MPTSLPYLSTPGTLPKILNKVCEATVPESFNGDFLGTKLGFPGGSARAFISWAKKGGLLNSDGTPTQLYKNFRNPSSRGSAMAESLKKSYAEVYTRNEYAHILSRADFTKLVSEITGMAHDSSVSKQIVGTYFAAKSFADFDAKEQENDTDEVDDKPTKTKKESRDDKPDEMKKIALGLNYTINLVLPKTDDPAIYKAIFKSLKENLLNE
jgi:hypothetical protein